MSVYKNIGLLITILVLLSVLVMANSYSTSNLGNVIVRGNMTVNESLSGDLDNLVIGSGSDSHSLTSPNDLFVTGKLEVDGASYFDGSVNFYNGIALPSDSQILFGSSSDSLLRWDTTQTPDTLLWGLGVDSLSLILTSFSNRDKDHDHLAQDDPTIILHANEDPDNDNTKWGSFSYSNVSDEFRVDTGEGSAGTKVMANLTAHNDFNAQADVKIGDTSNFKLFDLVANGSNVLLTAYESLPMIMTGVGDIIGQGDNVRIGNAGVDSHSLTSPDDLFVSGKFEADGPIYLDGTVTVDGTFAVGNTNYINADGKWRWGYAAAGTGFMIKADATPDQAVFTLGTDHGTQLIFAKDVGLSTQGDYDHPDQDNPTVFIQSSEDPDDDNTKWGSLSYSNNSDFFEVNTGETSKGTKIMANLTAHNDLNAEADLIIGDTNNQELFTIEVNGTNVVIESLQELEFIFIGGNITMEGGSKFGDYNSTCAGIWSPAGTGVTTVCDT